jgi:hypothetical protein
MVVKKMNEENNGVEEMKESESIDHTESNVDEISLMENTVQQDMVVLHLGEQTTEVEEAVNLDGADQVDEVEVVLEQEGADQADEVEVVLEQEGADQVDEVEVVLEHAAKSLINCACFQL